VSQALERLLLHLETTRAGWLRGLPVRAAELDAQVDELMALLVSAPPSHLVRAHGVLARLRDGVVEARARAERELAAIPARRRAVRAHACLQAGTGVRLRRGA
jgi:hypothetical protein